jgi:hypothetical protein
MSADRTPYDDLVPPSMEPHVLPDESQRSHWYAYELTGPLQLPLVADNVLATTGDPLIAGEEVDAGGC